MSEPVPFSSPKNAICGGATHSEGAEGKRVVRADLTTLFRPHRRLVPARRDSLSVASSETGPVFCRSERDHWSRLYTSRHDSSIFQRGDVGRADQADGGFVRFAVFGDDDRFQRLVVAEHRIDVVQ